METVLTKNYKFVIDTEESDETTAVKMYDLENGKLISDNYHASHYLWEVLAGATDEEITEISAAMEYNRTEIVKEYNEENN